MYKFMEKNQNRLEEIGGHFEKCCKNDRNWTKFSNFNYSQTTEPILTLLYPIVLYGIGNNSIVSKFSK